jgi:hypothetical protein
MAIRASRLEASLAAIATMASARRVWEGAEHGNRRVEVIRRSGDQVFMENPASR